MPRIIQGVPQDNSARQSAPLVRNVKMKTFTANDAAALKTAYEGWRDGSTVAEQRMIAEPTMAVLGNEIVLLVFYSD